MTPEDPEARLRRLFAEARLADENRARPFKTVLRSQGMHTRRSSGTRVSLRSLGLFAASALLLAVYVLRSRTPAAPQPNAANRVSADLSSWKSATDFLLDTPGAELLRSAPVLRSSLLAPLEKPPSERKGRPS